MPGFRERNMRVHRTDSRYHQRQQEDDCRAQESISLTRPPPTPAVVTIPQDYDTNDSKRNIDHSSRTGAV